MGGNDNRELGRGVICEGGPLRTAVFVDGLTVATVRRTVVGCLVGVLVVLAACSGSSSPPSNRVENRVPSPLAPLLLTPAENVLAWNSREREIGRCMAGRGFEYAATAAPQGYVDAVSQLIPALPDEPGDTGFRGPLVVPAPPDPTPPGYDDALIGMDDVEGCAAQQSVAAVDGETLESIAVAFDQLLADLARTMMADPRYQALIDEWSACVLKRGFRFAHPVEMISSFYAQSDTTTDAERSAASADAACRASLQLENRLFELLQSQTELAMTNPAYEAQVIALAAAKREIIATLSGAETTQP